MNKCIGIIKSGKYLQTDYSSLTKTRPDYMLPFGGRYRTVDFTLSNFSKHNLSKVLVFAGANIRSTLDHIGNGKNWGLDKRHDGLMINPPSYVNHGDSTSEIQTYFNSLTFFEDANHEYIYISDPMVISRIDITKAYREFIDNDYDVMFLYRKQKDTDYEYLNARKLVFDEGNKPTNIGINLGTENIFNMYIEKMFIKKEVFMNLVKESIEKGDADNLLKAIFNNKHRLNLGSLEVFRHVEYIRDLNSYFKANLNLLNPGIYADLLLTGEGIRTKSKDEPSTLYVEGNKVTNSLVANGCIIKGEVENSILFRGVKIGKNAIIKNSLIFQKAVIEDNAVIINAIVDKNCTVKEGVFVQGTSNNPHVVEKNMVVKK
ncbi:MAG: glucose-1-phosphate adenylyltransferase subunit GlgD [Tissierellia bacterium]|nr:glucose-1-phosphate adenylyltransferase subunit GlgD [Tissierellia bacterium]